MRFFMKPLKNVMYASPAVAAVIGKLFEYFPVLITLLNEFLLVGGFVSDKGGVV